MKKVILLFLALIFATSCLERADQHSMRTAYGAAILYEGTTAALVYGEYVLTLVEMDIVAEAPVEKKDRLADKFFPFSKFRVDGNRYTLVYDNVTRIEVTTDGQPLTTPGAKWKLTKYGSSNSQRPAITVTCLTPNSWELETSKIYQGESFSLVILSQRTKIDVSPRDKLCEVSLAGEPIIDRSRAVLHSLTTESPLIVDFPVGEDPYDYGGPYGYNDSYNGYYTHHSFIIVAGIIVDEFENPKTKEIESVDAQFISHSISSDYSVVMADIRYGGFTDSWYWDGISSYNKPLCSY